MWIRDRWQCDHWQEKSDCYIKVFERRGESVSSGAQCVISGSNYSAEGTSLWPLLEFFKLWTNQGKYVIKALQQTPGKFKHRSNPEIKSAALRPQNATLFLGLLFVWSGPFKVAEQLCVTGNLLERLKSPDRQPAKLRTAEGKKHTCAGWEINISTDVFKKRWQFSTRSKEVEADAVPHVRGPTLNCWYRTIH